MPVIIIDKLGVDTFNDYNSFTIWINSIEISRNVCGPNVSELMIVWRVIYEGHEKYSYGTAYEYAPKENVIARFKYGDAFQNRIRPTLPLLLCENTTLEKNTIINSFKGAFTSWFEPYLINDMNYNAARSKKPQEMDK